MSRLVAETPKPFFWLPGDGLAEKSRKDRLPYDVWRKRGFLTRRAGQVRRREFVSRFIKDLFDEYNVQKIGFDRWGFKHFVKWLLEVGFKDEQIEAHFVEFGQGFQSMSPARCEFEGEILNGRIAHGGHPVLEMCIANAVLV